MTHAADSCPTLIDDETARRYAAGRLPPAEADAFEQHMLLCARCQNAVSTSSSLAAALQAPDSGSRWQTWSLRLALPLAAALLLTTWYTRSDGPQLDDLARVDVVPSFSGTAVRAGGDSAVQAADAGMAAYDRGDYREAASVLERATPSPTIAFFLGVARLKTGDYAGALSALHDARAAAPAYARDAAVYIAKTWLATGKPDSALAVLQFAADDTPAGRHAAALADSIRMVIAR